MGLRSKRQGVQDKGHDEQESHSQPEESSVSTISHAAISTSTTIWVNCLLDEEPRLRKQPRRTSYWHLATNEPGIGGQSPGVPGLPIIVVPAVVVPVLLDDHSPLLMMPAQGIPIPISEEQRRRSKFVPS